MMYVIVGGILEDSTVEKKWLCLLTVLLFLTASVPLMAQSNEVMDDFLDEEKASFGKTAYFTLLAVNLISEDASIDQAVSALGEQGWGVKVKKADDAINMGELSFLIMQALDIPGGLMYKIAPGPRYASRELVYLGIVPGRNRPGRIPSGDEVLSILGRALEWKEERS
jgi:hypothetical protein